MPNNNNLEDIKMDGFKSLPKMQCFKEGGKVAPKAMCYGGKMKKGGDVKDDMAQDKKLIKKAFKQHDEAEHDKEPTEIKLRKGGRAKKETGTVKKFKDGGSIGVYGAKKKSGDLDSIEKAKDTKPKKAAAPSKASTKPNFEGSDVKKTNKMSSGSTKAKEVSARPKDAAATSGAKGGPNKYKTGGGVKKFADGGSDGYLTPAQERTLKMVKTGNYRSKPNEMNYAQPAPSSNGPTMPSLGPANNFPSLEAYRQAGSPTPQAQKKGGDVKKFANGMSTGVPSDEAHKLALMKEMQNLPPYMQLQLLNQQQQVGGNNSLNQIANQMNPMPQQQMPMMPNVDQIGNPTGQ
jgi:hypothetical protein